VIEEDSVFTLGQEAELVVSALLDYANARLQALEQRVGAITHRRSRSVSSGKSSGTGTPITQANRSVLNNGNASRALADPFARRKISQFAEWAVIGVWRDCISNSGRAEPRGFLRIWSSCFYMEPCFNQNQCQVQSGAH